MTALPVLDLAIDVQFKSQGNLLLATANLGNASDDRVLADLVKLFDLGVDAIACQEAGDRGRVLVRLAKIRADIEFWDGDGSPGAASTPVVWSTRRITATRKITVPLTGRKHVGNQGAGPAWVKAKVLNVVLFAHAETGALFWFGSMHIIASVRIPIRRGVARRQVQGAADWVVLQTLPVYIGADWNMPAHHKLMAPLRGAGLKPGPDVVTHGRKSAIDRIWGPTAPDEQHTVSTSSDHEALVDAYTITRQEDPVPTPDSQTITGKFVAEVKRLGGTVYTHREWGSKPDGRAWPLAPDVDNVYQWRRTNKPHRLLPDKPVDTLWQHITVTADTGPLTGDFFEDMQTVERIGFDRFGSGMSYNIGIGQQGEIGIGQFFDAKGTHTVNDKGISGYSYDQNYVALAMAYIAMPGNPLTAPAKAAMILVVQALINIGALTRGHDYVPHSLVAAKDCPTDAVREAMAEIHREGTRREPQITRYGHAFAELERAVKLLDNTAADLDALPETRVPVHKLADDVKAFSVELAKRLTEAPQPRQ